MSRVKCFKPRRPRNGRGNHRGDPRRWLASPAMLLVSSLSASL